MKAANMISRHLQRKKSHNDASNRCWSMEGGERERACTSYRYVRLGCHALLGDKECRLNGLSAGEGGIQRPCEPKDRYVLHVHCTIDANDVRDARVDKHLTGPLRLARW